MRKENIQMKILRYGAGRRRMEDITGVCYLAIFFDMLYFYCRGATVISGTRLSYITSLKYYFYSRMLEKRGRLGKTNNDSKRTGLEIFRRYNFTNQHKLYKSYIHCVF